MDRASIQTRTTKCDSALPESVFGRIRFGLACLLWVGISGVLFYGTLAAAASGVLVEAATVLDRILKFGVIAVFESICFGSLIFSVIGVVWAIAGPPWAEGILQFSFRNLKRLWIFLTAWSLIWLGMTIVYVLTELFKLR